MKFLIQRVTDASVSVDDQMIGQIGKGFLVFIGINQTDTKEIADKMVKKLLGLRIFEDANGKTNLDLQTVSGGLLLISQFTLYADCRKGNRPSFVHAGSPEKANELNISLPVAGKQFRRFKPCNVGEAVRGFEPLSKLKPSQLFVKLVFCA